MSGPYRISGTNGRVKLFCERCGKVAGPTPFGGDEVFLTTTERGTFCDKHITLGGEGNVTARIVEMNRRAQMPHEREHDRGAADVQRVFDFIDSL